MFYREFITCALPEATHYTARSAAKQQVDFARSYTVYTYPAIVSYQLLNFIGTSLSTMMKGLKA